MPPIQHEDIYEDTNPRDLPGLLSEVHSGTAVLPEFQRDFVWEPANVAGLIDSILQSYPAGSLLRLRNSKDYFRWRLFEGVAAPTAVKPVFLVLDGQQRLTSLYQALYGVGPHRFFLDLKQVSPGAESFEDAIFWERSAGRRAKRLSSIDAQIEELIIPLSMFANPYPALGAWIDQAAKRKAVGDMDRLMAEQGRLKQLIDPLIDAVRLFRFPVVTLKDSTSAAAVCTIFETLNRTGVKLTPFELLTARYYSKDLNLREKWEEARTRHPILVDYEVDPYSVLQAITLLNTSPPSVKRGKLMDLAHKVVSDNWDRVCASMAAGLELLQTECGVVSPKWLPYAPMLVTLAAVLAERSIDKGVVAAVRRRKIIRWFWGACLGQTYESASNSQIERDFSALKIWLDGGVPPANMAANFDVARLDDITPRQRALHASLLCLVVANAARDFHTGKRIDFQIVKSEAVDDHHIFPLDHLGETDRRRPKPKFDCILNHTLIDGGTNKSINANAPPLYLQKIEDAQGPELAREIFESHLIGAQALIALRSDDYDAFLNARRGEFEQRLTDVLWDQKAAQ